MPAAQSDSRTALRRSSLLSAIVIALFLGSTPAVAQDALLDRARSELVGGNPGTAYAILEPAEEERAGEPAYDYLLGIAALDAGKLTNAVFALERVVAVEPNNMLARAELARAYAKLREFEAAQTELDTVRGGQVPEEARAQVDRYLGAVETAISQSRTQVRGYLSAGYGYDSNVNSATDDSEVALPGLGPVGLAPGAIGKGDQFARISGGGAVRHTIRPDLAFNAGINFDAKINSDLKTSNTDSFSGFAGVDYLKNDNTWTVALQGEHFRVDDDAYRNAVGVLGQIRRPLDNVSGITGFVQATHLSYTSQSIRDANRYTIGAAYSRALTAEYAPVMFISGYGGTENETSSGVPWLGHDFVGARAGLSLVATREIDVFLNTSIEYRDYGGADPLFRVGREDMRYNFRVALDYKPDSFWTITPAMDYTRNDSNIAINDYDRSVFGVTIRRDFR